jgi:hypothetical protein
MNASNQASNLWDQRRDSVLECGGCDAAFACFIETEFREYVIYYITSKTMRKRCRCYALPPQSKTLARYFVHS